MSGLLFILVKLSLFFCIFLVVCLDEVTVETRSIHLHRHQKRPKQDDKRRQWNRHTRNSDLPSLKERLIHTNIHEVPKWVDWKYISELIKQGKQYFDVTDLHNVPTRKNSVMANVWKKLFHPIPSSVKFETTVTERTSAIKKDRIRKFIEQFTSYSNRLATNALGSSSQQWLRTALIDPIVDKYDSLSVIEISPDQFFSRFKQKTLIVRMEGSDRFLKDEVVIIGAHCDSINSEKSPCLTSECLTRKAPGADDDASGLSVVLEALQLLAQIDFKRTIEFHFYTASEFGIRGSLVTASVFSELGIEVVGVLCFDTVGYGSNPIAIHTTDTHPQLNQFLRVLIDKYLKGVGWVNKEEKDLDRIISDYLAWSTYTFPSAFVTESKPSPYVHSGNDTLDKLNLDYIKAFVKLSIAFLVEFGQPIGHRRKSGYYDSNEDASEQLSQIQVNSSNENGRASNENRVNFPATEQTSETDGAEDSNSDESWWLPLRPGKDFSLLPDILKSFEKRLILRGCRTEPQWVTENEIESILGENGLISFIDITDFPNLRSKIEESQEKGTHSQNLTSAQIPKELRHKEEVLNLLNFISKASIERTIEEGIQYPNRQAFFNFNGQDYSKYLYRNKIRWLIDKYEGLYRLKLINFPRGKYRYPQENVILSIEGTDENLRDEIVILGAHTDSISSPRTSGCLTQNCITKDSPGVDDDMSGVAVLIECINALVMYGLRLKRTVQFHFYSGGEHGLLGSGKMADLYLKQERKVVGMLNFDMVGYTSKADLLKIALATENVNLQLNEYIKLLAKAYTNVSIEEKALPCSNCQSDYAPWSVAGYPAAYPYEYENTPYMHTPNDTLESVTTDLIMEFAKLGVAFIVEFGEVQNSLKNCSGVEYWNPEGFREAQQRRRRKSEVSPFNSKNLHYKSKSHQNRRRNRNRIRRGEDRIFIDFHTTDTDPVIMNEDEIAEDEQGERIWIDISSDPEGIEINSSVSSVTYPIPTEIRFREETQMFLRKVFAFEDRFNVMDCIQDIAYKVPIRSSQHPDGRNVTSYVLTLVEKWIERYTTDCISIFEVKSYEGPDSQRTVVLRIIGADPILKSQVIVLGAHLDSHRKDCLKENTTCVTPGADDASGLCTLMAIINTINNRKLFPRRTIEFHFYAASKEGLRESYSIASDYKRMNVNVVGMLNLGTIGYSPEGEPETFKIGVQTMDTHPELTRFIRLLVEEYCNITWVDSEICSSCTSDFMSWSVTGFPTAQPHEYVPSPYINSEGDTHDTLNYEYIQEFIKLGLAFVMEYGEPFEVHTPFIYEPALYIANESDFTK